MNPVQFHVPGLPKPQGSKRHVGGGRLVESSKELKAWRRKVSVAARDAFVGIGPYAGPVFVDLLFRLPRPKSHYRTGRFAHLLRDDAPDWVTTRPDVDKLVRGCLDALSGYGYVDDALVVSLYTSKRYVAVQARDLRWERFATQPGVIAIVRPAGSPMYG